MFHGHRMFIGGNRQKGSRFLSFPVYRCLVDTKSDFSLNNSIATLSLISISSVRKKSPANVLKLDLNSARWMPKLVSIDAQSYAAWRHNLCALRLVRCKPIDLFCTTSLESQESYLTTGMLPCQHFSRSLEIFSACTVLSHGFIMLPPRQPRVFARLACWQITG